MFIGVAVGSIMVVAYLSVWTAIDPSQRAEEYELTEQETPFGETIVGVSYYCNGGDYGFWRYVAIGWNLLLLICASVLAFQTRNVVKTFNESRTLAFLIYSHSLFVVLRTSLFVFQNNFSGSMLNYLRTLLISIDQISACFIYFLPKFTAKEDTEISRSSFEPPVNQRQSGAGAGGGSARVIRFSDVNNGQPSSSKMTPGSDSFSKIGSTEIRRKEPSGEYVVKSSVRPSPSSSTGEDPSVPGTTADQKDDFMLEKPEAPATTDIPETVTTDSSGVKFQSSSDEVIEA
jgi:hypothetical protein